MRLRAPPVLSSAPVSSIPEERSSSVMASSDSAALRASLENTLSFCPPTPQASASAIRCISLATCAVSRSSGAPRPRRPHPTTPRPPESTPSPPSQHPPHPHTSQTPPRTATFARARAGARGHKHDDALHVTTIYNDQPERTRPGAPHNKLHSTHPPTTTTSHARTPTHTCASVTSSCITSPACPSSASLRCSNSARRRARVSSLSALSLRFTSLSSFS